MSLYIGRHADPASFQPSGPLALIPPDRLTRHAVCLGMTGSGKTGLCVALLEEVALAGVPIVLFDPKGDVSNLALAFPDADPAHFRPWVDEAAARQAGRTVEEEAQRQADRAREAREAWQLGEDRVRALVERVSLRVLTPGSAVGSPVDITSALRSPPPELRGDAEGLSEYAAGTATSLLGLLGLEGDPAQDPPFVVVRKLFEDTWIAGRTVDLAVLAAQIADPPFSKVGVFPLETFWPRDQRMKIAMALSARLSSPSFAPWTRGAPMDPSAWFDRSGKTPVTVFYLAHLDEPSRRFFLASALDRIVAWSRRQPGSSSLRALVYFDEVWGYLPPYPANPPTKRPVLALMKQARAVGVGTMLVTQNPVDVDYSALGNAGLWMIGRLQTDQDRSKVLDGLSGSGVAVDKPTLAAWIARLPPRSFIIRDVSEPAPWLVHSRQTISFLRGPLTREEIARLNGATGPEREPDPSPEDPAPDGYTAHPPPAPAQYPHHFLRAAAAAGPVIADQIGDRSRPARADGRTIWEPALYARLDLGFDEGKSFAVQREEHRLFFPLDKEPRFCEPELSVSDLDDQPPGVGWFAPLPAHLDEKKELDALRQRVIAAVLAGETERMYRHSGTKLDSRGGEDLASFQARVEQALEGRADAEIAKLEDKARREVARLEAKKDKLARDLAQHEKNAQMRTLQEVASAGETVFGVLFGRKKVASAVTSAMSRRATTSAASARADAVADDITALEREIYEAGVALEDEAAAIRQRHAATLDAIEEIAVRLDASDAKLIDWKLVWIPVSRAV